MTSGCRRKHRRWPVIRGQSCLRMVEVPVVAASLHVRVAVQHVLGVLNDASGHIFGLKCSHQLFGFPGRRQRAQRWFKRIFVGLARCERREACIASELRRPQDVAERVPLRFVVASDGDPTIRGAERFQVVHARQSAVWRRDGVAVTSPRLHRPVRQVIRDRGTQRVDDRFHLRQLHALPLAGTIAVAQRRQDRHASVPRIDHVVRVVRANAERRAVGKAGHLADSSNRREHSAEAEKVAMRPFEPLHGRVRRDQTRVNRRQLFVAQVPLVNHPRGEVGEEDVRLLDQPVSDLLAPLTVQVELHGKLAGVEIVEVARDVVAGFRRAIRIEGERARDAQRIELRLRFDADHFCAERRERLSADRASAEPRKVGHADPVKRQLRHFVLPAAARVSEAKTSSVCSPSRGGRPIWTGVSERR